MNTVTHADIEVIEQKTGATITQINSEIVHRKVGATVSGVNAEILIRKLLDPSLLKASIFYKTQHKSLREVFAKANSTTLSMRDLVK